MVLDCDWLGQYVLLVLQCVNGPTVNYDHIHDMLTLTQKEVADFRQVCGQKPARKPLKRVQNVCVYG